MKPILLAYLIFCSICAFGGTYWVSPTGIADWATAESATPLDGTNCTSLTVANANITAGDTAYLREGTYTTHILPDSNGATNNVLTYSAYDDEVPLVSNGTTTYATYYHGLALPGKTWVKIHGIHFQRDDDATGTFRLLSMTAGASFNELSNCVFDGRHAYCVIFIWDGGSTPHPTGDPCIHNWVHGCTFKNAGGLSWTGAYVNDDGGFQLGVPTYDSDSSHNTIEGCTFYGGGHHNLETFTKYNVIRSNWFHFEGSISNNTGQAAGNGPDENGLWGNRNIQIYDGYASDGTFNLLEGNLFLASGPSPDDDGGDGLTITSPKNIVRYNTVANSQNNGVLFKLGIGSPSNTNRFYNNTIFNSGRFQNTNALWQGAALRWYGSYTNYGTKVFNNIFYRYKGSSEITGGPANPEAFGTILTNNWFTTNGDPSFTTTNWVITDATNRDAQDFTLQAGSGAIDAGIPLTLANGAGSTTTTLIVDDALFFQDGTWGSVLAGHVADTISIGTKDNRSLISSIDYDNNTITLVDALSWDDDAPVWLYAKNDGVVVWSGDAPDLGAYEYTTQQTATPEHDPDTSIFFGSVEVTITCATEGATIYYSTEGTATTNDTEYSAPLTFTNTTTLSSIAFADGYLESNTKASTYTLLVPADTKPRGLQRGGNIMRGRR